MANVIEMPAARPVIAVVPEPVSIPLATTSLPETPLPPALRWIESWLEEPTVLMPLPDTLDALEAAASALAPLAAVARAGLAPADPAEHIVFLKAFADRHRLEMPDVHALELDA